MSSSHDGATSAAVAATAPVTHTTETITDRRKQRELAEARQSGNAAPEIDVKTGAMINPHNPEFLTRRPWYLGSSEGGAEAAATLAAVGGGPSLDHQNDQRALQDRIGLTLGASEYLLEQKRLKEKELQQLGFKALKPGMYMEGLRRNKKPYMIAKVLKISHKRETVDVEYEDGTRETKVKWYTTTSKGDPKFRLTKSGARSGLDMESKQQNNDSGIIIGKETYDSKRDSYHGLQVEQQQLMIRKQFQQRDELRKQHRTNELERQEGKTASGLSSSTKRANNGKEKDKRKKQSTSAASDSDSDSDYDSDAGGESDSDEEFVQKDADAKIHTSRLARQGGVGGAQMKVTARNLRIREDTAKYLRNLDPNSAYYDPKSRSMRDNPYATGDGTTTVNPNEVPFAGDNFARVSGDAYGLAETQVFAWDASEKGAAELHPQANPSQAELLKRQYQEKSTQLQQTQRKALLDKYGGAEYLDGNDGLAAAATATADSAGENQSSKRKYYDEEQALLEKEAEAEKRRKIRFGTSTQMKEYTTDGRVVVGGSASSKTSEQALIPTLSKYHEMEDIHVNGHTSVFGSYFHKGAFRWGYADDHSLLRNSCGTGLKGRMANDEANARQYGGAGTAAQSQTYTGTKEVFSKKTKEGDNDETNHKAAPLGLKTSKMYGETNNQFAKLDPAKVRAALRKQQQQEDEENKKDVETIDKRTRGKFHSIDASNVEVTEEEMEAYRIRKSRGTHEDPMANISSNNNDEVLEYKK